jgi:hypothetical protein
MKKVLIVASALVLGLALAGGPAAAQSASKGKGCPSATKAGRELFQTGIVSKRPVTAMHSCGRQVSCILSGGRRQCQWI